MKIKIIAVVLSISPLTFASIPNSELEIQGKPLVQTAAMEGPTAVCFNYSGQDRLLCLRSILLALAYLTPEDNMHASDTEIEKLALKLSEL